MASRNRVHHVWRMASAALVPLAVVAAVLLGSFSIAEAARRAKSSERKTSTSAKSSSASGKSRLRKVGEYNPDDETVEMFDAVKAGQIEVKLIPKDSTQGRVFIHNKTKQPLNVKLPDAFAARPVLAQMMGGGGQGVGGGMGGMGMGGGGGMGGGFFNVPGGMGMGGLGGLGGLGRLGGMGGMGMGGMGGMGMGGMGGMGMGGMGGGGFFNVPPEKEANFKVPCMCLEHGKPEPRAAMTYKIEPVESFSTKPGVKELCQLLGYGKISQRAAQVAAWHLNNDMSWEELAAKRIEHADGSTEPYFTREEIRGGMALVNYSLNEAKKSLKDDSEATPVSSPGESASDLLKEKEAEESR